MVKQRAAGQQFEQAQPAIHAPRQNEASPGNRKGRNFADLIKPRLQRVVDLILDEQHPQIVDPHHRKAAGAGRGGNQIGGTRHRQRFNRIQPRDPQPVVHPDRVHQGCRAGGPDRIGGQPILRTRGGNQIGLAAEGQVDQIGHPAQGGFRGVLLGRGQHQLPVAAHLEHPQPIAVPGGGGQKLVPADGKGRDR